MPRFGPAPETGRGLELPTGPGILDRVQVVIGPKLPGERVWRSIGGSRVAKVVFLAAGASGVLLGVLTGHLFLLGFAGFLLLLGCRFVPLSEVETDGLFLYVSQLLSAGRVPLTDVSAAQVGWLPNSSRIIVEFRAETSVGKRISYEPPIDWMSTADDHRSVRELRALIAQAKAAAARTGAVDAEGLRERPPRTPSQSG